MFEFIQNLISLILDMMETHDLSAYIEGLKELILSAIK